MKSILFIPVAFFLASCSMDARKDGVCSRFDLEETGDLYLVGNLVDGPVVGGRGPFGPSIAIELKKNSPSFLPLSRGVDEVSLWPIARGVRSPIDPHPTAGECMPWRVDERDAVVCGYDLENENVYVYVRYIPDQKVSNLGEYGQRTIKISSYVESEVFCDSSSSRKGKAFNPHATAHQGEPNVTRKSSE